MDDFVEPMRAICLALPEIEERPMSNSQPPELAALQNAGHPFFAWGTNWIGMVLGEQTDWNEVRELLADSYCIIAPKKLAAQVSA